MLILCTLVCAGRGCSCYWSQVWNWREPWWFAKVVCNCCGSLHLHLCSCICLVMGSPRLVGAQWDLSLGDSFGSSKYQRVSEHVLHFYHCADLLDDALPHEVWLVHLLRLLCVGDDLLHFLLFARNQRHSNWRNGPGLEGTPILVQIRWSWRSWQWSWDGQRGYKNVVHGHGLFIFLNCYLFFFCWKIILLV